MVTIVHENARNEFNFDVFEEIFFSKNTHLSEKASRVLRRQASIAASVMLHPCPTRLIDAHNH